MGLSSMMVHSCTCAPAPPSTTLPSQLAQKLVQSGHRRAAWLELAVEAAGAPQGARRLLLEDVRT